MDSFSIMGIMAIIFAVIFIGGFVFTAIIMITILKKSQAYKKQPRITSHAKLVSKRDYHRERFTTYYGTFEFESKDRIELIIPFNEAGYLVEGDEGELTFQGDRFIEFK